jgi:DNA-binding CsgD family transcriptional regulator
MASVVEELESVADLCGRVRFSSNPPELVANLLAPVASFLRAETASFRTLSFAQGTATPEGVVSLGVARSVDDAYLTRYFKLDPARRLLQRRLAKPLFASPTRPGEWSVERASVAERGRFRAEFRQYRKEFLLPNNFVHHLGFCLQDADGRTLLFDFHRPAGAPAFDKLELAKANILATYLHSQVARGGRREAVRYGARGGSPLSAREREVAEAVAFGLSNKELAARLNISVRTVENHLRSIFAKLNVTTRTRLAARLHEAAPDYGRSSVGNGSISKL